MEEIQYPHRLREQLVVIAGLLLDSLEQRFQSRRVRGRNTADVEKMHRGADRHESRIAVQAEAPSQDLERNQVVRVGELGAVVVEADCLARALARPRDPDELRVAVDE